MYRMLHGVPEWASRGKQLLKHEHAPLPGKTYTAAQDRAKWPVQQLTVVIQGHVLLSVTLAPKNGNSAVARHEGPERSCCRVLRKVRDRTLILLLDAWQAPERWAFRYVCVSKPTGRARAYLLLCLHLHFPHMASAGALQVKDRHHPRHLLHHCGAVALHWARPLAWPRCRGHIGGGKVRRANSLHSRSMGPRLPVRVLPV